MAYNRLSKAGTPLRSIDGVHAIHASRSRVLSQSKGVDEEEGGKRQYNKEMCEEGTEEGGKSRLVFMDLSREIRGMIWRRAMADFAPLQFGIIQKPLVDLTLDRTDISQADYQSYYCHFDWTSGGSGGEAGGETREGRHREGNLLFLRPRTYSEHDDTKGGVVDRVRHNRDLMLICREARYEVQRVLPHVLPLSGRGAMRINSAIDIFWFVYQRLPFNGMRRPAHVFGAFPPREARREGRQLTIYDRCWNELVHNVAEFESIVPGYYHERLYFTPPSALEMAYYVERLHEYPHLKSFLVVWEDVLTLLCPCRDCREVWRDHVQEAKTKVTECLGAAPEPGLPEYYTFHKKRRYIRNHWFRNDAPDSAYPVSHALGSLLHAREVARLFEVHKGEPDADHEVDDIFRDDEIMHEDQPELIHAIYHRYKWERPPTVSILVAVDETIKDISGRDWVAERLHDS